MLEKERVDFSLPDGMDPDTLIPIPLHCISDIFAWMAYTRVIHPQSAFAKDIETIRQAVWDVNKGVSKVSVESNNLGIEEGNGLLTNSWHFLFQVFVGNNMCEYPADRGDILVIEKIEDDADGDPVVTVYFKRYLTRVRVKKSYLSDLVRDKVFVVLQGESVNSLGG